MTGIGVPGWGVKLVQHPGSLCAPPRAEKIVILEEGNRPYPHFPKCDMFVSHKSLNVRNPATEIFRSGEEQKWSQLEEAGMREGTDTVITNYRTPLSPVSSFK